MAKNKMVNDVTVPNVRFGTSYLNTKYRDRAVPDEVLMDKSTGSVVYKRLDGSYMCFDRENFDIFEIINKIHTHYTNDPSAIYPTRLNAYDYENTHLVNAQFDLQCFNIQENHIARIEDGATLINNANTPFSISYEMNGFFIQMMGRPRDISLIHLMTDVWDRYIRNYNGDNENYRNEKKLMEDNPNYKGSSVEIHYTLRYYKYELLKKEVSGIGYGRVQEMSYIPFEDLEIPSREDYEYITLSIDQVSLPKVKNAHSIKSDEFTFEELELYEKIKDWEDISLKYIDIFFFSTITDTPFIIPNSNNARINMMLRMSTVEKLLKESYMGNLSEATNRVDNLEKVLGIKDNTVTLVGIVDPLNRKFYEDLGDGYYRIYRTLDTDEEGNPTKVADTREEIPKSKLPQYLNPNNKKEVSLLIIPSTIMDGIYDRENKKFYEDLGDGTYKVWDVLDEDEYGNPIKFRETDEMIGKRDLPDHLLENKQATVVIPVLNEKEMTGIFDSENLRFYEYLGDGVFHVYEVLSVGRDGLPETLKDLNDEIHKEDLPLNLLGYRLISIEVLTEDQKEVELSGYYDKVNKKFYEDLWDGVYKVYDVLETTKYEKPTLFLETGKLVKEEELPGSFVIDKEISFTLTIPVTETKTITGYYDSGNNLFYREIDDENCRVYSILEVDDHGHPCKFYDTGEIVQKETIPPEITNNDQTIESITIISSKTEDRDFDGWYDADDGKFYNNLKDGTCQIYNVIEEDENGIPSKIEDTEESIDTKDLLEMLYLKNNPSMEEELEIVTIDLVSEDTEEISGYFDSGNMKFYEKIDTDTYHKFDVLETNSSQPTKLADTGETLTEEAIPSVVLLGNRITLDIVVLREVSFSGMCDIVNEKFYQDLGNGNYQVYSIREIDEGGNIKKISNTGIIIPESDVPVTNQITITLVQDTLTEVTGIYDKGNQKIYKDLGDNTYHIYDVIGVDADGNPIEIKDTGDTIDEIEFSILLNLNKILTIAGFIIKDLLIAGYYDKENKKFYRDLGNNSFKIYDVLDTDEFEQPKKMKDTGNYIDLSDLPKNLEPEDMIIINPTIQSSRSITGIYDRENKKFYEDLGDGTYKVWIIEEIDEHGNPTILEETDIIVNKWDLPNHLWGSDVVVIPDNNVDGDDQNSNNKTLLDRIDEIEKLLGITKTPTGITGIYDAENKKFYEDLGDGTYKEYDVIETDEDGNPTKIVETGNIIKETDLPTSLDPKIQITIGSSTIHITINGIYDAENKKFYEDLGDGTYKEYDVIETDEDGNPTKISDTGKVIDADNLPSNLGSGNHITITPQVSTNVIGIYDAENKKFYEDLGDGTYKEYDVIETDKDGNPTKLRETGNIITSGKLPDSVKDQTNNTFIITEIEKTEPTISSRVEDIENYLEIVEQYLETNNIHLETHDERLDALESKEYDLNLNNLDLKIKINGKNVGEGITIPGGTAVGSSAPTNGTKTWIDTNVGGVLKYWNGTSWVPAKSIWG